jgi:lycopene beta-cyclase
MAVKEDYYDYIIAGAGCSGLSMLWHLHHSSLKNKRILVIDNRLSNPEDKIWSYWGRDDHPFQHLNIQNWDWLKVSALGESFIKQLRVYPYHSIRSREYHDFILKDVRKADNVTLLEADVIEIKNKDKKGQVYTSHGDFEAQYIFQSLRTPKASKNKVHFSIRQHFVGWEIKTEFPVFDPTTVILMDFRPIHNNAVCFYYVLPFDQTHALLEYTLFSNHLIEYEEYTMAIQDFIRDDLHLTKDEYHIIREERGNIPMEDRFYSWRTGKHIFNLGAVGGLTKPTTGYTFKRIQTYIPQLVEALEQDNLKKFANINHSSFEFVLYDRLFLYLLQHQPETAIRVFRDLFKNNPFDRVLAFLCEETNWKENLQIMRSVPTRPFLESLWNIKRILMK